uniref:Uncharacterized protein n=1 Tax=Oryza barthii TaxID=65489 RepID=A0A0D3FMH2_9ORYZ
MAFGVSGPGSGDGVAAAARFGAHVVRGRWFMFFASILIMAAAGGTYIFGIYSKAIKTSLGYDQQTLNTLSFFKDVGANVGVLPGLINEHDGGGGEDDKPVACMQDVFRPPARGEDYTILQALFSVDMAVLFVATICGIGGTLTAIDNMGQIGQSLGYPQRSISTFVSLVSIWNYAGRVAAGFGSEYVLAAYKLPRPLALTAVLLLATAGHLLIALGVGNGLYAASVILGFCFGAQWPLLFAIISEVFGLKYYSTLYNFGAVASPVGSYILNVRVTGHLYDREAERQLAAAAGGAAARRGSRDLTCAGVRCFRVSFLIIAAVTLLGAAVSLLLAWRTRKFYRGDLYGKFREVAMAGGEEGGARQVKVDDEASGSSGGGGNGTTKANPRRYKFTLWINMVSPTYDSGRVTEAETQIEYM